MHDSRTDTRRDMRSIGIAGAVLFGMALVSGSILAYAFFRMYRSAGNAPASTGSRVVGQNSHRTPPPPSSQGYVGSAVCGECHADIAEKYASHPMAHSLADVNEANVIENYDDATFSLSGSRVYRVERRGDEVLHHEMMLDADGKALYDQAEPVRYVMGSGQYGRGYVIDRGGLLFQSPISWYTHAAKWGLSPGYSPGTHVRFDRRIDDSCLTCHAGRVATDQPGRNRYGDPPFLETSIGCERCHGPGQEHVKRQHDSPTSGEPDPTIVNPARLDTAERESVCYQCHLHGEAAVLHYGRSFFDFRPGHRLDEYWTVFVSGDQLVDKEGRTRVVSQVEQMRVSRCYVESEGKLGCTSCHDPHSEPSSESRVEYYQQRCLACHQEHGCSLPLAQQQEPPALGSCIACHMARVPTDMPHVAHTDHRILRRPDLEPRSDPFMSPGDELTVFDHAERHLPASVLNRARGLALVTLTGPARDENYAESAEALLIPVTVADRRNMTAVLEAVGDDEPVLNALGVCCLMEKRWDDALSCWQRILQFDPKNELALRRLLGYFHDGNDLELAFAYSDRLMEVNPYLGDLHGRRAHIYGQAGALGEPGAYDAAIESALKGLQYDPTNLRTRDLLATFYEQVGKSDLAAEQRRIIEGMKAAIARPK